MFLYQRGNATFDSQAEDFHIFVMNGKDLENSFNYLDSMIKARKKTSYDYWLIDVTGNIFQKQCFHTVLLKFGL